jgi:hypothetical protein
MKNGVAILLVLVSASAMAVDATQFMAALQLAIDEPSPELTNRSQKLVREQLDLTFKSWPEFKGRQYDVRTDGREIVFYMMTGEDMQAPLQHAISSMIQRLNGRVRARGRSLFYKTPMSPSQTGYLDVGVDDQHKKILYASAQAVPLRHLLKELKSQLGTLSYLIPGECADQLVDWSFGDPDQIQPKTVDAAMSELATLFGLKYEKRNDTHIFSGGCTEVRPRQIRPILPSPSQLMQTSILSIPMVEAPANSFRVPAYHPTVYFPLVPLGD